MSDTVIRVEGLSKRYLISHRGERSDTLRHALEGALRTGWRRLVRRRELGHRNQEEFWALRDVSVEINKGEAVGLVGRNGAGKSTFLKILSRITEPTTGRIRISGRLASLLEVGTGFHAELTGRENIFLNGAILGMTRREITKKFDEIVAFADIEQFLDTPVKRYSSGMYVRLAFAVAAHLEPEILIVDEVLAVGDTEFQKKCLGKMQSVSAKEGRTVIFVSHNLSAIQQLCPTAMLFRQGKLITMGPSGAVIQTYLQSLAAKEARLGSLAAIERSGSGKLRFTKAFAVQGQDRETQDVISGMDLQLVFEFRSEADLKRLRFGLTIYNDRGIAVSHCNVNAYGLVFQTKAGREGRIICNIPTLPLPKGEFRIAIAASDEAELLDLVPSALVFSVQGSVFYPSTFLPPPEFSAVLLQHSWRLENLAGEFEGPSHQAWENSKAVR